MSSNKSSRKRTVKVSSDSSTLSFDLLSNLTYMAAVASGGTTRDIILEWTIKQPYKTVFFFRQVYLLSKRFGFEYARAFQMVARTTKAESVKNLLLRFAGAITSGVSEMDFLSEEARVEREQYINDYYRSLEALIKWGDAYAALLVSVALIVVVSMISTMLSELGTTFVLMLTGSMVIVTAFGVYIIYRTAPVEVQTYQNRRGPIERVWAKRLFVLLVPAGALLGLLLGFFFGAQGFFFILGLSLLPTGLLAMKDHGNVSKRDREIAPFMRSLGNVTASLGTTVSGSLDKLDRRSLAALEKKIKRLQTRLARNMDPDRSWEAFRDEVGSELMSRTTRIFVDAVNLGAPPEKVGSIASAYAMDSALMRDRRAAAAAPFAFLVIPLHFAMVGLLVFVLEIMRAFNFRIQEATAELAASGTDSLAMLPDLPVFRQQDLGTMANLTMVAIITMTIGNALTPKLALGGHPLITAFFGSITCIMTAVILTVVPPVASSLLLAEVSS